MRNSAGITAWKTVPLPLLNGLLTDMNRNPLRETGLLCD
jgi:hypothetical protein